MNTALLWSLMACQGPVETPLDTAPEPDAPALAVATVDRDYYPALIELIDGAEGRLLLAEYVIYDSGSVHDVLTHLYEAQSRGVAVRVLADEAASGIDGVISRLHAAGVDAKLDSPSVTTHNKLVIADSALLVGSHNFTSYALDGNTEASVLLRDPAVVDWYATYFEALWANPAGEPQLESLTSGGITPLYHRNVDEALLACIDGAQSQVKIVLYALAYNASYPDTPANLLVDALVAAAARGVTVQVALDNSEWVAENNINRQAIAKLQAGSVPLRLTASDHTTHAKMLLCDERVIVGDANWSWSSFNDYNGTSAQIDDVDVAGAFGLWADEIWNQAAPPPGR